MESYKFLSLADNFPYLQTTTWDTLLMYAAIAAMVYGCGLVQGIIGTLLVQHFMEEKKPMYVDQTQHHGEAQPPPLREPMAEDLPLDAMIPPMPTAEPTNRVRRTFPTPISVGLGDQTYRFHKANEVCYLHADYNKKNPKKSKRFTPCKECFPEYYSR